MSVGQVFRGTLAFLAALAFAYILLLTVNVWVGLLIAILVASAVRPAILRLQKWRVPQSAAILIVYGGLAALVLALLLLVLPPVINQFAGYLTNEDRLANRLIGAQLWIERTVTQITGTPFDTGIDPANIRTSVYDIVEQVRITAPTLVGNATASLGDVILIVVMGLYWITARQRTEDFLVELSPLSRKGQVRSILEEIDVVLGSYVRSIVWFRSSSALCFVILNILRIPSAGSISFFYAVATAIPVVGGIIGVLLGTFLGLLTSPINGVIVLVVTFLLQQVENYWLTPRMMSRGSDFDPLLVLVFVSIGLQSGRITGSLIAIPIAGIASILVKHLILEPRKATVVPTKRDGGILLSTADEAE
ncbi:MAG: AI-2E family transporter [Anaerolineae bacterium]